MDKKQSSIFYSILDKFRLPHRNIIFIQHRNLNEFKYFTIEKINPTHRIILYGTLKNNNKKKDISRTYIKVGEIIIGMNTLFLNIKIILNNPDIICISLCMFFINCLFFYLFMDVNILRYISNEFIKKIRFDFQTSI